MFRRADRLLTLLHEGVSLAQTKAPQLGGLAVEWVEADEKLVFTYRDAGRYEHVRDHSGKEATAKYILDEFWCTDQGDEVAAWLTSVICMEVRQSRRTSICPSLNSTSFTKPRSRAFTRCPQFR